MPCVPGFEYDIFISYAHIDNIAYPGQTAGWIEHFYKNLNLMLAKRFGRMDSVKIWWDNNKLDGNVVFDQSIEEGIQKSAIMICLNSPGYIASAYCKQELSAFYKKAQSEKTGLNVADRSRIINVVLNNIPHTEWLPELSGTTGFHFYNKKDQADFGVTVNSESNEFRNLMESLRDPIYNLLTDFSKEQDADKLPEKVNLDADQDVFTIYLGEVSDTLRTPRKRIINELKKKGFSVLAGVPPPDEAEAHEKATLDALRDVHLSIHLLDEYPGREVVGTVEICYPQKQVELALQTNKSKMIWVPAEMDFSIVEDERYKHFLQEIETRKASSIEYEFVRGSKSTVAKEIIDFAEQLKSMALPKKANQGIVSVLLDTHFNDQLYALDLCKVLIENQIQPFLNPQEDDPRKNINLLGERISQVRKLIFLYGSVSKEWVIERISAALQLIINNNYPIDDFFIYLAPPHKETNEISIKQKFLKVNVINSSNAQVFDKNILQQFITDLKTSAA